jgi:hypothetical protein
MSRGRPGHAVRPGTASLPVVHATSRLRVALGVTLLLAACQNDQQTIPPYHALPHDTTVTDALHDSLRLAMTLPARVGAGEPVAIVLQIANISGRGLDLYLRGRDITVDIIVRDTRGAVVWQKLAGASIPAILQLRPLAAGASLTVQEEWDQRTTSGRPVTPGRFVVEAVLLIDDGGSLRFPPARLEIGP